MLAVVLLSQHRVSSSKTVRPSVPSGDRCIGHAVRAWSAVCSEVPHSQFGEGARPHLCMDKWNRPTPVRRRLSLTQAARGKPIPTGLAPVSPTTMGSESTSHTTEDFYFENTMILGKNWESGNKLEVKTFFLENTMILGKRRPFFL